MTTRLNLILLATALFIFSCGGSDSGKKKTQKKSSAKKATKHKPSVQIGGTYSFGEDVETGAVGSVIVYPLTDSTALFFLDVCRGAPSYNLGQLFGQMTLNGNIGRYSEIEDEYFNCAVKFEFSKDALNVTTEEGHGECGFGNAVYADNMYKRIDKSIPAYFINGEGDTILFEGLTVEKYAHRFD